MISRRSFLQGSASLTAGLFVSRGTFGSDRMVQSLAIASVRDFGAQPDGKSNSTHAFNAAIASLPSSGGIIVVPSGIYKIDPAVGVGLRSNLELRMAPGAVIEAYASSNSSYALLHGANLSNLAIHGGELRGDRSVHLGATGEWGMGIDLRGCSDVLVSSVAVRDCWGDGFYFGHSTAAGVPGGECRRITMRGCSAVNNRRQGVSLTGCIGATIEDCVITDTGGTRPECGIDLEPNAGKVVSDVSISGCTIRGNAGWGVVTWGDNVTGTTILANAISGNGRGGIYIAAGIQEAVLYNEVLNNSGKALTIGSSAKVHRVVGTAF